MNNQINNQDVLKFTADIISAYVSHNTLESAALPQLIQSIYSTLVNVGSHSTSSQERPDPVVPIKKSIMGDYIICLEDGKKLKMLKRHLKSSYNMTPEEYRQRWGLSPDYPMVAPNYAKQRSILAQKIGLGTRQRKHK